MVAPVGVTKLRLARRSSMLGAGDVVAVADALDIAAVVRVAGAVGVAVAMATLPP
jgi:hypothetical protein